MNMFEDFAKINISGNNNGNIDKNNVKNTFDEKNIKKNKKIIHGNNVIFTRGQYKGYSGFMYELNSETLDVEIDEYEYVVCSMYGEYKNGTSIITNRGNSVIINKIDKMYALKLKNKETYFEIRLFTNQVSRFLCIYEDNMKKVVQIINEYKRDDEISYDIVKLDLEYKKYYNNQELMYMVSYFVCNGKYNSIATQHVRNVKLNGGEEFWMVVKCPDNKDDVNYIGNFGKLSRTIPEQYLIKYKKTILANNNSLIINEDKVTFKRGPYKNRTGILKNLNSSNLVIEVDAIGKKISKHIVKSNNFYKNRSIIPDDLFFKDIELTNGNFFQVKECTENGFIGIEKVKNNFVEKEITNGDKIIKKLMSGFSIVNDRKIMSFEKDTFQLEMEVIEEENGKDEDEDEENDEGSYNDDGDKDDIVFDSEVEMKQTFKDSERLEFAQVVLSKDDKNIMKLIEKCLVALSFSIESIKVYDVLESINDAVKKMKSELAKLGIIDWKTTDTKYIVACLVIYDILKNGYNFSKTSFNNFISKLFNTSFFKKNDIIESMFIQSDEKSKIETCFDLIRMNNQKKVEMKKFYKSGNVFEIVKMMMENCNIILQKWFGPVILSCLDEDIELFPVCKKVRENTKKFLTTQDILNNNIAESADRIIWGPSTSKMIKIWKTSLINKCENEKDETLKLVYKFVIDNFENAPFVLRNMSNNNNTNNLELLKYRELKRAFDVFIVKLKKFTDRADAEKIDKLKIKSDEKEKVSKRRNEIEMNHLNISFEKKVKVC